jgi:hypothetical protein
MKKYIECSTCKYNSNKRCNNTNSSSKCLVSSIYRVRLIIDGEQWIGKFNYFYYLWKPIKLINYLPENLFEI